MRPERPQTKPPPALPDPARLAAFRYGLSAETRAALLLLARGFWISARRFKTPVGEIDIVARRRKTLVFVEVEARAHYDNAAEAVTARQQRRIIAAARYWLASHPGDTMRNIRFDVVLVVPGRFPRHLPAAFDATV
jgi:putative endonuclease